MKVDIGIRNPYMGGHGQLTVVDTVAANDDIGIITTYDGQPSRIGIWRGDVHKLIAALEAHLKVRPASE